MKQGAVKHNLNVRCYSVNAKNSICQYSVGRVPTFPEIPENLEIPGKLTAVGKSQGLNLKSWNARENCLLLNSYVW